jgi:type IV pilus assembly protein PilP
MVLAVLLLAACGRGVTSTPGDAPNLEKWVEGERARPAQPLEPLPVMQQFETFEYSAQGMRDPFTDAWTNPQGNGGLRRIRTGARSRWKASRWTHWTWSVPSAPAAAPWRW